jgi:Leucine-rich repeat (LRR) protein
MMGLNEGMKQIKNMELADNKFTNINFITSNFPNLDRLQLSRNLLQSIDTISKLADMTKLNIRNNRLKELPD